MTSDCPSHHSPIHIDARLIDTTSGIRYPSAYAATLGGIFMATNGMMFLSITPVVKTLIDNNIIIILPQFVFLGLTVIAALYPISFFIDLKRLCFKCEVKRWNGKGLGEEAFEATVTY
eukprot:GHVN01051901.1.p1 GENE.GHVN01051901.1~~GHVN01051901.1.p1  ORF type:complete len:118 (-),score=14.33 GHVN01051901.1:193-546(-)